MLILLVISDWLVQQRHSLLILILTRLVISMRFSLPTSLLTSSRLEDVFTWIERLKFVQQELSIVIRMELVPVRVEHGQVIGLCEGSEILNSAHRVRKLRLLHQLAILRGWRGHELHGYLPGSLYLAPCLL